MSSKNNTANRPQVTYRPGDIVEVEIPLCIQKRSLRQVRTIIAKNDWSFYSDIQKKLLLEIAKSDANVMALSEGKLGQVDISKEYRKVFEEYYSVLRSIINSFGLTGKYRPFLIISNSKMAATNMYMGLPLTTKNNPKVFIQYTLTSEMLTTDLPKHKCYACLSHVEYIYDEDIAKPLTTLKEGMLSKITSEFFSLINQREQDVVAENALPLETAANPLPAVTKVIEAFNGCKKTTLLNEEYVSLDVLIGQVNKHHPGLKLSDDGNKNLGLKFFKIHASSFSMLKNEKRWFIKLNQAA